MSVGRMPSALSLRTISVNRLRVIDLGNVSMLGEGEQRPQCQAMRDRVVELKRAPRAAAKEYKAKAKNGFHFPPGWSAPAAAASFLAFLSARKRARGWETSFCGVEVLYCSV